MFVTYKALGKLGRLGNQLFQIAATIGLARKLGYDFVLPPWRYAQYMQNPFPQSTHIPDVQKYIETSFAYQEINVSGPIDLCGFFQSEKYFIHCETEIRTLFTPKTELLSQLRECFGKILEEKTCSVHVRRTDYVGHPLFADLSRGNYYEEALRHFDSETVFVCFSDDVNWCKSRFRDRRFIFIEGLRNIADLILISLCTGHIIANSSFSWWGAWLDPRKDKKVIAPAAWFQGDHANPKIPFRGMPHFSGFHDIKDMLPQQWIQLPVI
jgi:hypothetical protein